MALECGARGSDVSAQSEWASETSSNSAWVGGIVSSETRKWDNAAIRVAAKRIGVGDLHVCRLVHEHRSSASASVAASDGSCTRKLRAFSGTIAASHTWLTRGGVKEPTAHH